MRRIAPILIIALLACGTAWGTRYPLMVKDSRGRSVTISREPKRVVSIAPSNTEILFALGLGARIVGVTKFCNYPVEAKKKPVVGDLSVSVEKVISLKPDLVLAHGKLNDNAVRSLESHGLRVVALDPKTIDQAMKDILLVGKITNREKEASRVAGRISSARTLVKRKVSGIRSKPKVLVAVQASPLWAAGPDTFVNEMIVIAGGVNLASNARPGFNQFSTETAVYRDPDVIIGTTRGDKQVFTRGLWKGTRAVRAGRVYEADPDLLVRPGPRLADGILAIVKLVHPNVFSKR